MRVDRENKEGGDMKHIISSLKQLLASIKKGDTVFCRPDHTWAVQNSWISFLFNILKITSSRLFSIAYTLNYYYDQIERIPVELSSDITQKDQNAEVYGDLIEVTHQLFRDLNGAKSADSLSIVHQLKRKYVGLLYRIEAPNGGVDISVVQKSLLPELKQMAEAWKLSDKNCVEKSLHPEELAILKQTACYPLFVELLFEDTNLQKSYFEWSLRDKNPIAPFIEFPYLQQLLVDCSLNGRISRFGGEVLRIQMQPVDKLKSQKILTLPFEGKPLSLLDENLLITFRGNYRLTLAEVFKVFKDKMYKVGNLEFMQEGIINWNVHHLGWWDADKQAYQQIDLESQSWWSQLPLLEKLSKTEAAERYHLPADGYHWIVGAKATRGTPTLDYDQTHAFMEIAIPSDNHLSYTVYNFGKFSYQFPSSFFNSLSTFCLNMHATIAYPDENIFYTHRQTGCYPFLIPQSQGLKLMQFIKEDMIKARGLNLVFQIESENCAKWLYEKLLTVVEEDIPDFFRMSLMHTTPVGFVGACYALMRKLGLTIETQFRLLTLIHIPFGAGKGTVIVENGRTVVKSLDSHDFWKTSIVYLPALLVEKIHSGQLVVGYNRAHPYRNLSSQPVKIDTSRMFPILPLKSARSPYAPLSIPLQYSRNALHQEPLYAPSMRRWS